MRILVFNKDHPKLSSGYAKCLREIWINRLSKRHSVAIYATVPPIMFFDEFKGIKIYSGASNNPCDIATGKDSIFENYKDFNADLLFTQVDATVLQSISEFAKRRLINWISYVPIDFEPIPEFITDKLKSSVKVIAMSKWAEKLLRKSLDNVSGYVYHGTDTDVYKPIGESKIEIRKKFPNNLSNESEFLITIVQKNGENKAWIEQLEGIKFFIESNPDIKTKVYIHSFPSGIFDLQNLIRYFGLEDNCIIANPYKYFHCLYSENDMSMIYNFADVNLNASAEGFGFSTIEAMACGTPTIGMDFGTSKELLKRITPELTVKIKDFKLTPKFLRKPIPDSEDIAKKLEVVANKGSDFYLSKISSFSKQNFNWDIIIKEFMKILEKTEQEIKK